MNYCW